MLMPFTEATFKTTVKGSKDRSPSFQNSTLVDQKSSLSVKWSETELEHFASEATILKGSFMLFIRTNKTTEHLDGTCSNKWKYVF